MDNQPSRFDRYLAYIKNNRYLAIVLIVGTVFMAVSSFTSSMQQLIKTLNGSSTPALASVTGQWQTALITHAYAADKKYSLRFDFIQQNESLLGTVTEIYVEGIKTRSIVRGIMEGQVKNQNVSFYTQGQVVLGSDVQPYKELYSGVIQAEKIEFVRQNNLPSGGVSTQFTAIFVKPKPNS